MIRPPQKFSHVSNPDGTVFSFCRTCMTVVSVKRRAEELDVLEKAHECSADRLASVLETFHNDGSGVQKREYVC